MSFDSGKNRTLKTRFKGYFALMQYLCTVISSWKSLNILKK